MTRVPDGRGVILLIFQYICISLTKIIIKYNSLQKRTRSKEEYRMEIPKPKIIIDWCFISSSRESTLVLRIIIQIGGKCWESVIGGCRPLSGGLPTLPPILYTQCVEMEVESTTIYSLPIWLSPAVPFRFQDLIHLLYSRIRNLFLLILMDYNNFCLLIIVDALLPTFAGCILYC